MFSKDLSTKIVAGVSAGIIFLGGMFGATYMSITGTAQEQKPYNYVLKDFENLNVDRNVTFDVGKSERAIRLLVRKDRPVFVSVDKNVEGREMELIKKVVDYYDKIFKIL